MIEGRQRCRLGARGFIGKIAHLNLQDNDREPADADENIEKNACPDPGLAQRKATEMDKGEPGDRLKDRGVAVNT